MNCMEFYVPDVCAVIVTYHPDELIADRVNTLLQQAGHVIIVDNGSGSAEIEYLKLVLVRNRVTFLHNETNLGLAAALNRGIREAKDRGYNWLVLLDQDSTPDENMVRELYQHFLAARDLCPVALIGANFRVANIANFANSPVAKGINWQEVEVVITSGMFMPLSTVERLGPFRELFFVDLVDYDFCLRARTRGMKILMVTVPIMSHMVGATEAKRFLGRVVWPTNHSAFRRYLMTRNTLILLREYGLKEPIWARRWARAIIMTSIKAILLEEHRLEKFKEISRGVVDGILKRYDNSARG